MGAGEAEAEGVVDPDGFLVGFGGGGGGVGEEVAEVVVQRGGIGEGRYMVVGEGFVAREGGFGVPVAVDVGLQAGVVVEGKGMEGEGEWDVCGGEHDGSDDGPVTDIDGWMIVMIITIRLISGLKAKIADVK